mgnify:CR=1 FL=1
MIKLKGMTWDHSRGYDPMIATSIKFSEQHNNEVSIKWDKRPLQAFADRPIEEMTDDYDLIVIDYPHVGEVAAKGLLQNLDTPKYQDEIDLLKKQSVGSSHDSYFINGKQWALAIDAASQVSCYREDLFNAVPKDWNALIDLSKQRKVLWPLKPVHAISSFYSIYNNLTEHCNPENREFIDKKYGVDALQRMKVISNELDNDCLEIDPIQVSELMSTQNNFYYCPYLYGFSNYSRKGFREHFLTYCNVMDLSGKGPSGTHLGGTGIAVSKVSNNIDLAMKYAHWVAGADCQKDIFYKNGGQPGNAVAWEDKEINLETNNFFVNTRLTLDMAWVRPRHNGYMKFQDHSGDIINDYLKSNIKEEVVCQKLCELYKESFEE